LARRLLSGRGGSIAALGVGLVLGACRRGEHAPAPAASGSALAAARAFTDEARAAHFEGEKQRASEHWNAKPELKDCAAILHGEGDAELCRAASSALSAIEQLDPATPAASLLPVLADGSLALARVSERARYQSLVDIGQKHINGDAGAPPAASVRAPARPTPAKPAQFGPLAPHDHQRALELGDSPSAQFLPVALRLERDALRNLGAYLEYAPLDLRRSAFETVKRLNDTHPQWPLLDHLIREAALLESDPDLKQALLQLAASGLPRGKRDAQPASSK
jgi:hypothetical protein